MRRIIGLPLRYGGMGIHEIGELEDDTGKDQQSRQQSIIEQIKTSSKARTIGERNHLIKCSDRDLKTILINASIKGASAWLHQINHSSVTVASKLEFHDAMAVRYDLARKSELKKCSCGEECNVTQALSCKTNGMTIVFFVKKTKTQ
ncbi:hypothetical protein GJ496_007026 [Pomphorhynchus laevis]|nr:hypothetical protein GJ496_007026 [Pomphorhynchus laevis]